MKYTRQIEVCMVISEDMKNDISKMEGQEFNGKNVAVQFGNQAAAIASLSLMLIDVLKQIES